MVTTKSGTPDKPKYSFKFYQGFKYAYQLHDMMTSSEWLDLLEEEAALGGPKFRALHVEPLIWRARWELPIGRKKVYVIWQVSLMYR